AGRVFHIYSSINPNLVVTIAGLTITNGVASGVPGNYRGGGILSEYATTTVSNCPIRGNSASAGGGGIFHPGQARSPAMTVVDCTISGNSMNGPSGSTGGGGLYNYLATMTVSNCTISGNDAGNGEGGGIFNDGRFSGSSASLMVIASTVSSNSAGNN